MNVETCTSDNLTGVFNDGINLLIIVRRVMMEKR
jgi:hypothetical protein